MTSGASGGLSAGRELSRLRRRLERLYHRFDDPAVAADDPVAFVHRCERAEDQEVVGLIAAVLAYGRLAQIRASVGRALAPLGDHPAAALDDLTPARIRGIYAPFRHRFTTGRELAALLIGVRRARRRHGSLGHAFLAHVRPGQRDVIAPATAWIAEILPDRARGTFGLLPSPADGSACKRTFLFLRWMLREDSVDPGTWAGIVRASGMGPRRLIVPLDTHMQRVVRRLGLTRRRSGGLRTAEEVTAGFRRIRPSDPVRYDFALTHASIRALAPARVAPTAPGAGPT